MKKKENIQIRIDSELKDKFFEAAERKGITPSDYIRQLMEIAALHDNPFSIDDRIAVIHQAYLSLVQMLFKASYSSNDPSLFDSLMKSDVFEYYKEFTFDFAHATSKGERQSYELLLDNYLHKKLDIAEFADNNQTYKHSYPDKEIFMKAREKAQSSNS